MVNKKEVVYQCLSEITGLEPEELLDLQDEILFEAGILDSLSFVTFISKIEKNLQIKIDLSKINFDDFKTINTIVSYLENSND